MRMRLILSLWRMFLFPNSKPHLPNSTVCSKPSHFPLLALRHQRRHPSPRINSVAITKAKIGVTTRPASGAWASEITKTCRWMRKRVQRLPTKHTTLCFSLGCDCTTDVCYWSRPDNPLKATQLLQVAAVTFDHHPYLRSSRGSD